MNTDKSCIAIFAGYLTLTLIFIPTCLWKVKISSIWVVTTKSKTICSIANTQTHNGKVIGCIFGDKYKRSINLAQIVSQIVLHWINNENLVSKQWVCNRTVEIRKLTDLSQWKYISINENETRAWKSITTILVCTSSDKSGSFSQNNKRNKLTDEDASSPATSNNRELSSGHVNKCDRVKFCARLPP